MSEGKKGIENGNCNRTACQMPDAIYYNSSTEAWYCASCAYDINEASVMFDGIVLCKRPMPTNKTKR